MSYFLADVLTDPASPHYLTLEGTVGRVSWLTSTDKAFQFARAQDAEQFARVYFTTHDLRAIENLHHP